MRSDMPAASQAEIQTLRELTERVGGNPLLTQASTGNTSIKLDGILWIKASGRWMADALQDDILIPLDLVDVRAECLQRDVDPAERYPGASLETAMHAILPHRVVLHAHCVNTISCAVRRTASIRRSSPMLITMPPITASAAVTSKPQPMERAMNSRISAS